MKSVNKLIIGVAAGAILGVLYAPDKGSITRRKLSRRGNDLRERLNNIKGAINDKIEDLNDDLNDYASEEIEISDNETSEAAFRPHSWQ